MLTKEICVQKYNECKLSKNGDVPEYREFLEHAAIDKRHLVRLFGSSAYSKLQVAAGDAPNKLQLERTPVATIMRQFGDLVVECGMVPPYAEWDCRGLKPTDSGLNKTHGLKWSEFPEKFLE